MARTSGKARSKPAVDSTPSKPASTPASSSSIPEPFVTIPARLRPLTSTLPTNHVYTVHIDSTTVELKKRVFVVPVLMNLIITMLLVVRLIYAAPVYLDQIITIFGFETAWTVEPSTMSVRDITGTIAERTGLLMIDYAIFGFVGSWPWEFFFGSRWTRRTGPVDWRRKVGFRPKDIIVRKGRKWDTPLFAEENKTWTRADELSIMSHVQPAMVKSYTNKTGYLLLDKDYDLEFKAMIDAHRLVDKDRLDLKDLDHIVLVHYKNQWLLWRVHEEEAPTTKPNPEEDAKIRAFRNKLASLGQEEVFFRWIETVQYETSLTGTFTEHKQTKAVEDLRKVLLDRGVDPDKFWKEIGGSKGVPGLSLVDAPAPTPEEDPGYASAAQEDSKPSS